MEENLERFFCDICPKELELKVEHYDYHATFLNLDITIEQDIFIYNFLDKRYSFPISIVKIPHIESNIPQNNFYSTIKSEFLKLSCSTLCLWDLRAKVQKSY